MVVVRVLHRNRVGGDDFLGQACLDLRDYDVFQKPKTRYRVSHITGPTLFLLFSRVLEHIQRNFS